MEMLLIAFDSTQQALRAEMLLEYAEVEIDIRPTPKQITAGCALSIEFPEADLENVRKILVQEKVEIRGIFRKIEDQYVLI
jgi:DNA-binding transcriptional regulator WhiA